MNSLLRVWSTTPFRECGSQSSYQTRGIVLYVFLHNVTVSQGLCKRNCWLSLRGNWLARASLLLVGSKLRFNCCLEDVN